MFKKKSCHCSLKTIAFLQALGVTAYCSLIAILFWRGNQWFGKVPNYIGPLLFLVLFSASALVCAIIALGYPVILFWEKKQRLEAVRLVAQTALWLVFFVLVIMAAIILF